MINENDLGWLAGLTDAEACLHVGMNKARNGNVVALFQVGLIRHGAMDHVRHLLIDIAGPVPEMHVRPATATQREFYSISIAAKQQVLAVVEALLPYLHGKRVEALISADILRRSILGAQGRGHHTATDLDRRLCELSHLIKRGDEGARWAAVGLLGATAVASTTPTAAWFAGMFDGDGSPSVVREARGTKVLYERNVNISSSDLPALSRMREVVAQAYGVTSLTTQEARGGARPGHRFNIATADIERFLADLRPHLRVKAAEADVMLDVCRGKTTREDAYGILRALKKADNPDALLKHIAAGGEVPDEPSRVSRVDQYRRPTYAEMAERGLWSSEQARQQLGGIKHAVWTRLTKGLEPNDRIGNKKYYSPRTLHEHVSERVHLIVRADARQRVVQALDSWGIAESLDQAGLEPTAARL